MTSVALFTRDLRVHDNPVLAAAAADGGPVVPVFVLDDAIAPRTPAGRSRFLHEALADLDAALRRLGGRLVLRKGDVVAEVCRVVGEAGAQHVHVASDVTRLDTRPGRVLNPLRQAARYDPRADYVRRHVPELAGLTDPAQVHQPWRSGGGELRRLGYPEPIVAIGETGVVARRETGIPLF